MTRLPKDRGEACWCGRRTRGARSGTFIWLVSMYIF